MHIYIYTHTRTHNYTTTWLSLARPLPPIPHTHIHARAHTKKNIAGNVDKLNKALAANPAPTLQALVRADKAAGRHKDKNSATVALLWFKRYVCLSVFVCLVCVCVCVCVACVLRARACVWCALG